MKFLLAVAVLAVIGLLACALGALASPPTRADYLPMFVLLGAVCSAALVGSALHLAGS